MENLNASLYANELLEEWSKKDHLLIAEDKLLSKYVVDKTKTILDVGTGGGRLAFYLENLGFYNISAFDIVPEMIIQAKSVAKTKNSTIEFIVADAAKLSVYNDNQFDYLLYLQQVLNFIPEDNLFNEALIESFRIAKKDAIALFAFLDYESRLFNKPLNVFLNFLRFIRKEKKGNHCLPWIKINNKFNWKLFNKSQACALWVKRDDILIKLKSLGYTILEVNNANQLLDSNSSKRNGMLYVVCKK